jgi:NAD(P)-dependent dehydrogenase (short-subunit alcohol dehydrogenase family)
MTEHSFREQVVIVTGASSGTGRELALQLAGQGAWLALAARRAARLEEVADRCRERGGRALVVPTDVTDPGQCESMVARTLGDYRRLNMLVNDAGISPSGRFDQLEDLALVERVMRVNYLGSVYCTYYALPHLKQTRGRIVALSSLSAVTGMPRLSAYVASKKAMVGFYDSLRAELAPHGVSVTVVYPSYVDTRDPRPAGEPPLRNAMSVETCASLIVAAAARRKREEVMTFQGKLARWFKLVAPGTMDRMVRRAADQYL